ncbi:hypothetical protein Q8A73_022070 [Channa argus]|nr:hypothetical protein Q8A73_022070 [Channa argus]
MRRTPGKPRRIKYPYLTRKKKKSTDKLPRQPWETEALAEGRDAAQKLPHPSHTLCGTYPASHLTSRGMADRGGQARTVFWRPEGLVAIAGPSLPGARRGSEASVPPRARLRPAALGLSFTNQAPFSQSKIPAGGNWPKVLLSALNNSPSEMPSHKRTIHRN